MINVASDQLLKTQMREWQDYRKKIDAYPKAPRGDIRVREARTPLEASLFPRLIPLAQTTLTYFYDFADYLASMQRNLGEDGYSNDAIDYVRYITDRELSRFHYAKYLGDVGAYSLEYVESSEQFTQKLKVLRSNIDAAYNAAIPLREYKHHPEESPKEGRLRLSIYIEDTAARYAAACDTLSDVEALLKPLSNTGGTQ